MKVTVDLRNDCTPTWAPDKSLCRQWVRAALKTARHPIDTSVSISLVTEKTSAELNSKYRGKTGATNVLSFPSEYPETLAHAVTFQPLGDVVICPDVVAREAIDQNKELKAHWAHLTIHGILHLIGHDHEQAAEARKMEQLEISALQSLGIADPYSPKLASTAKARPHRVQ